MASLSGFEDPISTPQLQSLLGQNHCPALASLGLGQEAAQHVATTILWFPLTLQHFSECSCRSVSSPLFYLCGLGLAKIVSEENITVM